ncbi:MAG: fatty-acyl-CoA synthase [Alphaproteobacteria bacterium]|nr:fatty-acyl-CoA synthase [Alphaproteobacteria bacterium]
MQITYAPLRTLRDIEELERVPLDERVFSWNLNDWLTRGCALDPAKIAIRYIADADPASEPLSISYAELQARSNQAANLFHSLGVSSNDVVLYVLPTLPQLYVTMLGALACGIACGVNWMLKPEQLAELVRSTKAKVVVTLGPTQGYEVWENMQAIRPDISPSVHILTVPGPGGAVMPETDLDTLAARQPADRLLFERKVAPDDIAAYVHSGGTTGSPKLVQLTHRGFAYKCWANAVVMAHTSDDVIFADYPMFHIAGIFARGYFAIAHGMSIVIPTPLGARDKRFIENYWKFVARFGITIFSGVPTTLAQLAKSGPHGETLGTLRDYACTGSTAFPAEVARQIESLIGVRVLLTYGATEYTQNVTQAPRDGDPKFGSPGIRLPYTQVKAVELEGDRIKRECAVDEIGVVVVKGPSITPGYLEPKYNEGVFTRDGWFNSGDLGRFDADGYLWLTGRVKDVIIRGGHNIDPSVIEETLLKHRDVVLAAAVSKPDAYAGELPIAYVQLVAGARASADEIRDFALAHIPERAAAPKDIIIVEQMPLTDVQKPAKVELRRDAARRAFREVLADVADGKLSVDMVSDPVKGNMAVIGVADAAGARSEVEAKINERMKAFATAYTIRWTG